MRFMKEMFEKYVILIRYFNIKNYFCNLNLNFSDTLHYY